MKHITRLKVQMVGSSVGELDRVKENCSDTEGCWQLKASD